MLLGIAETTDAGIVAFAILHPSNAELPMLVTLSGTTILLRLVQPLKALEPMSLTPFPIVTLVRLSQSLNAESPIFVTISGITHAVLVLSFMPVISISLLLIVKL